MTYLGIDIGTSGVKALLIDEHGRALGEATAAAVEPVRPHPGWSEQNPADWWTATLAAIDKLKASHPGELASVRGIGLSGHMHGATLLGKDDEVLRPAILWNDGRSAAECKEMEAALPSLRQLAGNIAMPGFTAPKIAWVRKHEPDIFAKIEKVLLPKAYVRLLLTGEHVEDMSDAAGTLWLDVGKRDWSDELLAVTGLNRSHMPRLVEGSAISGESQARAGQSLGYGRAMSWSPAAPATMPPRPAASAPSGRAKASSRSAPRACSSSPTSGSAPIPKAPCMPSATPSRHLAPDGRHPERPPIRSTG